jgi:hypothetical protein
MEGEEAVEYVKLTGRGNVITLKGCPKEMEVTGVGTWTVAVPAVLQVPSLSCLEEGLESLAKDREGVGEGGEVIAEDCRLIVKDECLVVWTMVWMSVLW